MAMLRNLGSSERLIWLLDRECPWNFAVHARVRGVVSGEQVREALHRVQTVHPMLRVSIARGRWGSAAFVPSQGPIPLAVEEKPEDEVTARIESEIREPFEADRGPLARCVLLLHDHRTCTLIATFHHSTGDAMSGFIFLSDLASVLAGEGPTKAPLPLAGPVEHGIPSRFRGPAGALGCARLAARTAGMARGTLPQGSSKGVAPRHRKACLVQRIVEPEVTEQIRTLAREHGTTVHGALGAACMRAVAAHRGADSPLPFVLGSDVNLRDRLEPPVGRALGFFITGLLGVHRVDASTDFWALARDVVDRVSEGIARGDHFHGIGLLRFAARTGSTIAVRAVRASDPGMMVLSNIGSVSLGDEDPSRAWEKVGFASSFSTIATFGVHVATVDGTMVLDFVGMAPVHRRRHVEEIADRVVVGLRDLC